MFVAVIVLSVTVYTVGYVCLRRIQFFVDFVSFLSMIIYEVLYSLLWCLRYNICSAWFLDIRISTCWSFIFVCIWQVFLKPVTCKPWIKQPPNWLSVQANQWHVIDIWALMGIWQGSEKQISQFLAVVLW